jgi:hypothetical protein
MSNRARLGLTAGAVLVAVVAFLALKPDEGSEKADDPSSTPIQRDDSPTATARSAPPPPPEEIVLRGGAPQGGVARIEASKGDLVRIVVSSDAGDEIHLHGYDVRRRVAPGRPARFRLGADIEGDFEIESHTAEDAGREPLIGRLVVEP